MEKPRLPTLGQVQARFWSLLQRNGPICAPMAPISRRRPLPAPRELRAVQYHVAGAPVRWQPVRAAARTRQRDSGQLPYVPPGEASPDVATWEPNVAVFGGGDDGKRAYPAVPRSGSALSASRRHDCHGNGPLAGGNSLRLAQELSRCRRSRCRKTSQATTE